MATDYTRQRAIGISFGDNDFHRTFRHVLHILSNPEQTRYGGMGYNADGKLLLGGTKQEIADRINLLSGPCYQLYQARWDFDTPEHLPHTIEYLKIAEGDILLDDEVYRYLLETDNHNGEFFYVLLTLEPGDPPMILTAEVLEA